MRGAGPVTTAQRGFTLVELLLAVTLMTMLLGLAYGGLRSAIRSTDRGQVLLQESGQVRSTHQFVRRQLNQMLPLAYATDGLDDEIRTVFTGDANHIQFVAPMPGYLGAGGPQVQRIEVVAGDEGLDLLFTHALLQDFEEGDLGLRDPVVLLEGVADVGFQFLGEDEEGELTGWQNSWEETDKLPVSVRLDIAMSGDTPIQWPALIAGVRVDGLGLAVGGAGGVDGASSAHAAILQRIRERRQREQQQ